MKTNKRHQSHRITMRQHPKLFWGCCCWYCCSGRQIHWEPGNKVPTKCIGSSKFIGRIHALLGIDKFNRRMWAHKKWFLVTRINFLWQELISWGKNWFLVTRIEFLWQELISYDKNWFLVTRINLLWQELISCTMNPLDPLKIRFYKDPAGQWITLSRGK